MLEAKGIRCWIAPRDITPGADWGEAIVDGINGARAFVLVFSENANTSQQIKREVERAVNRGLAIIPLRIEDVKPAKTLEYFISTPHWLDAFNPPLEKHLNYLAEIIRHILDGKEPPPAPAPTTAKPRLYGFDRRIVVGGALGTLVVVALGATALFSGGPPSFTGKWKATKIAMEKGVPNVPGLSYGTDVFAQPALEGSNIDSSLEVSGLGQYHYISIAHDTGTVITDGRDALKFTSDLNHVTTRMEYTVLDSAGATLISAYAGNPGDMGLLLTPPSGMAPLTMVGMPLGRGVGTGIDRIAGTWRFRPVANPMQQSTQIELEITQDGRYRFKNAIDEHGMMTAADGKWTRTPQAGPVVTGTYEFEGSHKVTTAAANGTTVWERTD